MPFRSADCPEVGCPPDHALHAWSVLWEVRGVVLDDTHNDAEQPEGAAENFDDEHLDENLGLLSVAEGAAAARYADADPADEVTEPRGDSHAEHAVPGHHRVRLPVFESPGGGHKRGAAFHLVAHDDGHDDSINGYCFTKNDTNQVLASNTGRFDGGTNKRTAGQEDAPRRAQHTEAERKGDAKTCPGERGYAREGAAPAVVIARFGGHFGFE